MKVAVEEMRFLDRASVTIKLDKEDLINLTMDGSLEYGHLYKDETGGIKVRIEIEKEAKNA